MRTLVVVLGAVVFIAGVFLFLGNVIGFFRTFPLAGYLTMIIGGAIYRVGSKMGNS